MQHSINYVYDEKYQSNYSYVRLLLIYGLKWNGMYIM